MVSSGWQAPGPAEVPAPRSVGSRLATPSAGLRPVRVSTPRTARPPALTAHVLLLNKPFGALCQFRSGDGRPTLADYLQVPDVYAAGRLDADSEGLVLLTADGRLQHAITSPGRALGKKYWVQVEGTPADDALARLRQGVDLGDYTTRPARVQRIPEPSPLWTRDPPIRYRAAIPTAWLEIELHEGRNRQIRRMTARVGHPTLRLIRFAIGPWVLGALAPGEHCWAPVPARFIGPIESSSDTSGRLRARRQDARHSARRERNR